MLSSRQTAALSSVQILAAHSHIISHMEEKEEKTLHVISPSGSQIWPSHLSRFPAG